MTLLLVCFIALIGSAIAADGIIANNTEPTDVTIANNNYTVERHVVTTEDGYILTNFRIPASPTSPAAPGKPVVFLMHGIVCSSDTWIAAGPARALPYVLADAGYDVWIGNARGSTYSRNHTSFEIVTCGRFWEFSWHEIGYYDLPAIIDLILATTGLSQLSYVGHSQGTTVFYVLASTRPEYNSKIKGMISLAPIAFMDHAPSPAIRIAAAASSSTTVDGLSPGCEFLPSSEWIALAGGTFCQDGAPTQDQCGIILYVVGGFNEQQEDDSLWPFIYGHHPAGASTNQVLHYGQLFNSKRFRWYDYGFLRNLIKYNSLTPPNYELNRITVPVWLMYGRTDLLSDETDVLRLADELSNVKIIVVNKTQWSHSDFVFAREVREEVNDPVKNIIDGIYGI